MDEKNTNTFFWQTFSKLCEGLPSNLLHHYKQIKAKWLTFIPPEIIRKLCPGNFKGDKR